LAKVSVIIPVFNNAKYVAKSVASALTQTFTDIEVIVINDGSNDRTLEVLHDIKDARLKVYTQNNLGAAAARNLGISMSTGYYIALLDSDDMWLSHKLDYQVAHLENNSSVAVSFCYSMLIDSDCNPLGPGICPPAERIKKVDPLWILMSNPLGSASTAVIRRDVLEKERLADLSGTRFQYFNEDITQVEDTDLWIRIAARKGQIIQGIPEILNLYRVHSKSISAPLGLLKESLSKLRTNFFQRYPDYNNARKQSLSKAFHYRYLAQVATTRSNSRSAAVKFLLEAFRAYPLFLTKDLSVSLATSIAAVSKFCCGSVFTKKLIYIISKFTALLFWTRFRKFKCSHLLADYLETASKVDELSFSVVIPSNGQQKSLLRLLESLNKLISQTKKAVEVILVDNSSQDDSTSLIPEIIKNHSIETLQIKVLKEPRIGAAFARDTGAKGAKGNWLLFVDDDVELDPDYLNQAQRFIMADSSIAVMAGPINGEFEDKKNCSYDTAEFLGLSAERGQIPFDFAYSQLKIPPAAAMVVRKSAWLKYVSSQSRLPGRIKSSLVGAEDAEAVLLIAAAGYSIRYHPRMLATHLIRSNRTKIDYLCKLSFSAGLTCSYLRSILLSFPNSLLMHLVTPAYALLVLFTELWTSLFEARESRIVKIFFILGIMLSPLYSILIFIRGKNHARYSNYSS
jgi:glycosyltransferase involved in cell wall biosynthesis